MHIYRQIPEYLSADRQESGNSWAFWTTLKRNQKQINYFKSRKMSISKIVNRKSTLITMCLFFGTIMHTFAEDAWKPLFNGKNFDNWVKRNGDAEYRIEGEEIVGISRLNTPNTFLCTEKDYSDFILELELKVEPGLNSGIQFRSLSKPDYKNGRVHGYQCEIDPSDRKWAGGVYDEGRRGWLYPLTRNPKGQDAFKNGQWNKYRIEAIGSEIRTWINGVQCANLVDDMTASGFIALQVHGIKRPEQEGLTVRWKNIRILTEDLKSNRWIVDPEAPEISYLVNKLTKDEQRKGWRLLWDGQTTAGWRSANGSSFPAKGWEISEGVLSVAESGGGESEHGGDIVTLEEFSNFELELDFMIAPGANSGIKYFVVEGINQGKGSAIGLEFQILDDKNHEDAGRGRMGNRTIGSLYDLIAAENLSEGSSNKRVKGPGSWNKARLLINGSHVEHWLNDIKLVEYERGSQVFRNLVNKSKYAKYENFGQAASGHILLQDHGNVVHFRSIKIREF
jgi:hypothetical protein